MKKPVPLFHELSELEHFVSVCFRGLDWTSQARDLHDLAARIAAKLEPTGGKEELGSGARLEQLEAWSIQQKNSGFPYLFEIAVVRLVSMLESTVDYFVVLRLKDPTKLQDSEAVANLKGPILPFLMAEPSARAQILAEQLQLALGAGLKVGVGRFEAVLNEVGLGGSVSVLVRRTLLELIEYRNVIVHRLGKVDTRLLKSCPWLHGEPGARVSLNHDDYRRCRAAVTWYGAELYRRWFVSQDGDRTDAEYLSDAKVGAEETLKITMAEPLVTNED